MSPSQTKSHFTTAVLLSLCDIEEILMEDTCKRCVSKAFLNSGACRILSAGTACCQTSDQSYVQVDLISPTILSKVLIVYCSPPVCLLD